MTDQAQASIPTTMIKTKRIKVEIRGNIVTAMVRIHEIGPIAFDWLNSSFECVKGGERSDRVFARMGCALIALFILIASELTCVAHATPYSDETSFFYRRYRGDDEVSAADRGRGPGHGGSSSSKPKMDRDDKSDSSGGEGASEKGNSGKSGPSEKSKRHGKDDADRF